MKVMHYYTYPENAGGPLTYIRNIMESKLFAQVEFSVCYQNKPASRIRLNDIKRMIREIQSFSPDILHIHGVQSEGFIGVYVGRKANVPHILMTIHGLQIDAQNIGMAKRMIFNKFVEPYAIRNSEAVYCVCDEMSNRFMVRNNSCCLLPTIHNFIPDAFISKKEIRDISKNGKIIITSVGRVSIDKGMREVEEVIRSDNHNNVQYWIIGSGEYEEKMKVNLSSQIASEKVVFWGQQNDVKDFLVKTDIFLFLSHHENLSIALLEAASLGCCCIATNVGGNSEVILDGTDGILVSPMDVKGAIDAIDYVCDFPNYRLSMGKKMLDKIVVEYGEKVFSEKLLNVYGNLCEKK